MNEISLNILYLFVAIGMLWKGADWLVISASKIAHQFGISDLVIGLTIVAIGTSAPEFAVSISASLSGKSSISVGNVVGSNVFNLGFILGGCALIRSIPTFPKLVYRDGIFLIISTLILYVFLFGLTLKPTKGSLNRYEGIFMLAILICYLGYLFWKKESNVEKIKHDEANILDWGILLVSIATVVGGGHILVQNAIPLAKFMKVSDWVIAVTILAAGTSAPEFATTIMASLRGKHGMVIGNLIGSDLFNLLGVLGVASLIRPLEVLSSAQNSVMILVVMVVLVVCFMRIGWVLTRLEGGILVIINVIRWTYDLIIKS